MNWLAGAIIVVFLALMGYAATGLPPYADPGSPASVYVSPYYLENALKDTRTPNVVTAVLADYRGYDTLGETVVIFAAGLACILVLLRPEH